MRDLSLLPRDMKIKAKQDRKIRAMKREERAIKQIVSPVARSFLIYGSLSRATYDRSAHGWTSLCLKVALTLLLTEVLPHLTSKGIWHGIRKA